MPVLIPANRGPIGANARPHFVPPVRTKRSHLKAVCDRPCERAFAVNVQCYQCANERRSHRVRTRVRIRVGVRTSERGVYRDPRSFAPASLRSFAALEIGKGRNLRNLRVQNSTKSHHAFCAITSTCAGGRPSLEGAIIDRRRCPSSCAIRPAAFIG